jgi:hypothetical protein
MCVTLWIACTLIFDVGRRELRSIQHVAWEPKAVGAVAAAACYVQLTADANANQMRPTEVGGAGGVGTDCGTQLLTVVQD